MKISVIGLGYVGTVVAGCLARVGHEVTGVDNQASKVDLINGGKSPIVEQDIGPIVEEQVRAGRLSATTETGAAVARSDVSLVCVGTPSLGNGRIDLSHIRRVCEEIGPALRRHPAAPAVVIRSTVLPGTTRETIIPALEATSGLRAGAEFGVCFNPEFLREGTAVNDYYHPPKTVVGESDPRAGEQLLQLYEKLSAPVFRTSLETAEMVKYVDNTWHALKVGFANEIGSICKALAVDSFQVMDIFCRDTKLNISPYYLRPGNAFGGSCLPKDVRALNYRARTLDVETPILASILPSNEAHVRRGMELVTREGRKRVGVLGFSFKAGTDDLRESPVVEMIERLIGKGFDLRVYDANVNLARLTGANRDYLLDHIPHIAQLMRESLAEVLEHAEIVVIGNAAPEFAAVPGMLRKEQRLVDLVRIRTPLEQTERYSGICW